MGKRTAHQIWVDTDIWKQFSEIVPDDQDIHWAIEQLMKEKLKEVENAREDSAESAADVKVDCSRSRCLGCDTMVLERCCHI